MSEFIGWIPNISGDVTSKRYFAEHFGASRSYMNKDGRVVIVRRYEDIAVMLMYDPEVHEVRCIHPDCDVTIRFMDESGLCQVHIINARRNLDDEALISIARACWNLLKAEIDSSSDTICECRAMSNLFRSGANPHLAVLDGFIRGLEYITDSRSNISGGASSLFRFGRESREEAALRSNVVYFESFVRIYGDRLGCRVVEQYTTTTNLRIKKFSIATGNHRSRYSASTTAAMLMISTTALVIAMMPVFRILRPPVVCGCRLTPSRIPKLYYK